MLQCVAWASFGLSNTQPQLAIVCIKYKLLSIINVLLIELLYNSNVKLATTKKIINGEENIFLEIENMYQW